MKKEDLKIGLKVQFVKFKNGKRAGLEEEVYKIIEIDFKNWEACNCLLIDTEGKTVYTNHNGIEISDKPIKQTYKQISLFDLL